MNMNLNGVFNPENKFWSFIDKLIDVCTISILWLIFSIPIVTIGASTTALFHFTLKATADEEGYVFRSFWKAFVSDFWEATILWLGIVGGVAFLAVDLYYCQILVLPQGVRWFLFAALVSLLLVFLLTIIWIFPLLSFFRGSLKRVICHSFVMAVGNLYVSVTALVIYVLAMVLTWFMPLLFMVWFGLACYFASYFYRSIFFKYVEAENGNIENFP